MALLRLATIAMAWVAVAMSFPIDQQPVLSGLRFSGKCASIELFTMEWFLNNTKPQYQRPIVDKALFYTAGASRHARNLACGPNAQYVTIWQIWPEILYNEELKHTNPLHCIHRNPAWQEKYYSSMSEAYARMARETATVMHTAKDFSDPPLTGIWGKIELPVLRLKTNIKEMTKLSADRRKSEPWLLPGKGTEAMYTSAIKEIADIFARASPASLLARADSEGEACKLWSSMEGSYLDAN